MSFINLKKLSAYQDHSSEPETNLETFFVMIPQKTQPIIKVVYVARAYAHHLERSVEKSCHTTTKLGYFQLFMHMITK